MLKNLTDSEKEIAAYIFEKPQELIASSAKEIARTCYVSVPTIYRLCEKAGVSGLAELKVALSAGLNEYLSRNTSFNFDYPIKARESHDDIARSLSEDYKETIQSTMGLLDLSEMHKAVMAINNARRISIFTTSANVYFAKNFAFQMKEIGVDVNVPMDEYEFRLEAANCSGKDLAIIISFGGRGLLPHLAIKSLKKNNTRILLLTSPEENPLWKDADIKLFLAAKEDHANKISSFSTRLSLLYLLDNLYAGYFSLNYEENVRKKTLAYSKLSNRQE